MIIDEAEIFMKRKVSKKAKIRKRYNQVPHLAKDTTGESDKNTRNSTYKREKRLALTQQVTARLLWTEKIAWQTRNIYNGNGPQKKHPLEQSIKIFLMEGLN